MPLKVKWVNKSVFLLLSLLLLQMWSSAGCRRWRWEASVSGWTAGGPSCSESSPASVTQVQPDLFLSTPPVATQTPEQRPESPTVSLTWDARQCKVDKLHPKRTHLWWSLCTLHLLTCQVRVRRQLRSLLLCLCDVFQALISSLVCWFCMRSGLRSVSDYIRTLVERPILKWALSTSRWQLQRCSLRLRSSCMQL